MVRIKNYLVVLGIISIFLISACAQQQPTQQTTTQPSIITPAPTKQVVVETKASIAVDEQKVENGNVVVARVFLDKPGYVVIHKVADGKPGAVIGNSGLLNKENSNGNVKISGYENENELIAMLHYDDGMVIMSFLEMINQLKQMVRLFFKNFHYLRLSQFKLRLRQKQ